MTGSRTSRTTWRSPRSSGDDYDHSVKGHKGGGDVRAEHCVTDGRGYLLRQRPGCNVPVGRRAAAMLSKNFTDREIAALIAVEQLGMVTAEQLGRAFFNTHRSAYETLLTLTTKRFLVNPGADPLLIRRAVGHRLPPRSPVYALDWNGSYLLSYEHEYHLCNWRPATAGLITTRLGHDLGISEIWSYLLAAARATQEQAQASGPNSPPAIPVHADLGGDSNGAGGAVETVEAAEGPYLPCPYRLSLAFRNERASLLSRRQRHVTHDGASAKNRRGVLLQPDATFTFAIRNVSPVPLSPISPARVGTSLPGPLSSKGEGDDGIHTSGQIESVESASPRWSRTLSSWEPAFLPEAPSAEVILASEKLATADSGHTYYRSLLLEMETGANNLTDITAKIGQYNRLIRTNQETWRNAYGISPRVLVVVPTDNQVEAQALKWRVHYFYKQETAILLTSLQTLARVYSNGGQEHQGSQRRRALLEHPCWLDVMVDRWKSLGEALAIGIGR